MPAMRWTELLLARPGLAKSLILLTALCVGGVAVEATRRNVELEQRNWLRNEASRHAIDLMGQTLNGKLMGSMSVLGLIEPGIKTAAIGGVASQTASVAPMLEAVGSSYGANGVFIVGSEGRITASWDKDGHNSVGIDVSVRSYYQMAMQGLENVYAAVSIATGERVLYFAAPVYAKTTNFSMPVGAAVARVDLTNVNRLLEDWKSPAVLLTQQGVVFAANRDEWVYHVAGTITPERLQNIKRLKQFGNRFDAAAPEPLPFDADNAVAQIDGKRFAVEKVPVQWNDPNGDWTLVMTSDLGQALPFERKLVIGTTTTGGMLVLLMLGLNLLRSRHHREQATLALRANAQQAEVRAQVRQQLAAFSLRLQQEKSLAALVQTCLGETHRMLGALQGVIYAMDPGSSSTMYLAGSFACADAPPAVLALGEGLLGQCAVERRPQVIEMTPGGFGAIRSGLGETRPAAVMMAPILLNEDLLGAVEIALLTRPDDAVREQFEEMIRLLAMNIGILGHRVRKEQVLPQVREQES
ncbi:MAG: GAF domain-containing protein [Alphaproteobacteria bacterium]|nr:GAF domain-containing protein [Alphaproteobacteria bacterium]